jgi:uracil-DNA glycosylase
VTPPEITQTLRRVAALRGLCLRLQHIPTPGEERLLTHFWALADSPQEVRQDDVQAVAVGWRRWWRAGEIDRLLSMAAALPPALICLGREATTHLMAARVRRWSEYQDTIERCRRCKNLRPTEVAFPLCRGEIPPPPLTIRILFVGVAPARINGRSRGMHFYSNRTDLLRTGLFRALDASPFGTALLESNRRSREDGDSAFHRAGFFFVHSAKIRPTQRDAPPTTVLTACAAEHLRTEVQLLQPRAVCFLGNTRGHLPAVASALFGRRIADIPQRATLGSWNGVVAVTAQPRRGGVRRAGQTVRAFWRILENAETAAG